jgi:endonuclease III
MRLTAEKRLEKLEKETVCLKKKRLKIKSVNEKINETGLDEKKAERIDEIIYSLEEMDKKIDAALKFILS